MNAAQLRERLLAHAEQDKAVELATELLNDLNARINQSGVTTATHLLVFSLVAHGVLQLGARWWRDEPNTPAPEAWKALHDLATDLPPNIDAILTFTATGEPA